MEKLVAVLNPDGTYVGTSAPSGTQDVAITGQPIAVSGTVTANVGTGTQPVSGTVNAISTAPAGLSTTYGFSMHDIPGVVAANNFLSVFNPLGSGKNVYAILSNVSRYSISGATSPNSMSIFRITAASAGTLQAASTIAKGNTSQANTIVEVRTGNPTVTLGAELVSYGPPIATNSAPNSDQVAGNPVIPFILAPGEGLVYRTAAGDTDQLWNLSQYWAEI